MENYVMDDKEEEEQEQENREQEQQQRDTENIKKTWWKEILKPRDTVLKIKVWQVMKVGNGDDVDDGEVFHGKEMSSDVSKENILAETEEHCLEERSENTESIMGLTRLGNSSDEALKVIEKMKEENEELK